MIANSSYSLTIDELCDEVARLLKENDLLYSHLDNRISSVPDMRTIRYYSTLGLIDRPAIVGRVAKYNRRHIMQIVAIKTMQKANLPLSEIQELLYGLSEAELEALIDAAILDHQKLTRRTDAGSEQHSQVPLETVKPVYWREIVLQPGLKIMADQSWIAPEDPEELFEKICAAIDALKVAAPV